MKIMSFTSCGDEDLENEVPAGWKEFNTKIELGQKVKLIVDKHGVNENSQSSNNH